MYQRKNGTWCDAVTIDGKKKFFYGKTQKEVKKKLAEWNKDKDKKLSFADAANDWYIYHEQQTSVRTNQVYAGALKRAVEHFGDREIRHITPDEMQAFITALGNAGYARGTVSTSKHMLNMICNYAIMRNDSGMIYNPCTAVKLPHGLPQKQRLPPTDDQLKSITPDTEMGLFAYILLYTGLRRGELLALTYDDIDLEKRLIHVTKEIVFVHSKPVIKPPKSKAGVRDVDLLDVVYDALPKGTGYLFGGDQPWTLADYRRNWLELCRQLGWTEKTKSWTACNGKRYECMRDKPSITPHQLRHAYASMLDDAGIDETAAMTLLGHSSIKVTKDVYTHIRASKRKRSADMLNAYVNGSK